MKCVRVLYHFPELVDRLFSSFLYNLSIYLFSIYLSIYLFIIIIIIIYPLSTTLLLAEVMIINMLSGVDGVEILTGCRK